MVAHCTFWGFFWVFFFTFNLFLMLLALGENTGVKKQAAGG